MDRTPHYEAAADLGHTANRPDRRIDRATFLRLGAAAMAGLTLPVALPGAIGRAAAAEPSLTIDLSRQLRRPGYAATGFLHGLNTDGTRPPDDLLVPLKPQLFRGGGSTLPGGGWSIGGLDGYRIRWTNVVDRFSRASSPPLRAEYCIVLSDLWGANGADIVPTDPYPGDDDDWSNYETFLRQVISDAQAGGMRPDQVQFELWNEPDYGEVYWPRPKSQYEEMWRRGVRLIRELDPRARIEGPTFTRITVTENSWQMDDWLDMVVASDTAPDILSWHDLIPGRDPVVQAELARDLLAARGLDRVQLEINEYPASNGLDPGYNSWYVARMERARIDYGVLAIFGACCMYPELDGLLLSEGDDLVRTARWWVYQRYASITGALVEVTAGGDLDAVAGIDARTGRARILLGNARGDGRDLGTVQVKISGLGEVAKQLKISGRIPLRLERIPDTPVLDTPEVLRQVELKSKADEITVEIDWANANDAYVVTLGHQDATLPRVAIMNATPSPAILLPEEPTTVSFVLRNFTDRAITAEPHFDVSPAGYQVDSPASVTIPANGDVEVAAVLVRSSAAAAPGELTMTVLGQSETVPLVPTGNWVRIATLTASSTHPPSAAANLNNGDTDSEHWGGGGAGGWNDDTGGSFPDSVTASWAHPVPLARVRVFTLDSAGYPASAWGVRDYDVQVQVAGQWQTVARIRGNVEGVVESRLDPVDADALRILVLDSNDHAYSRLVELEAYSR